MTATPDFIIMDRIMNFLRPMCEGGFGAGSEEFIARCLRLKPDVARANFDALLDSGRLTKNHCGHLIPKARSDAFFAKAAPQPKEHNGRG